MKVVSHPSLKPRQKIVICKVLPFRNWEKALSLETSSVSRLPLKHSNVVNNLIRSSYAIILYIRVQAKHGTANIKAESFTKL